MADIFDEDPRKLELLEWLVTLPSERELTKNALAEKLGVSARTLRGWQIEPKFQEAWAKRAYAMAGGVERTMQVLECLYKAATDPQARDRVSAAKEWRTQVDKIGPQFYAHERKDPSALSDEELDRLIAETGGNVAKFPTGTDG